MDMALVRRMEELRRLSVSALKEKYREVLGVETRSSHKQYLFRRIAWQLQAQLEGGLSERALERAVQSADDADLRSSVAEGILELARTEPKDRIPSAFWNSSGWTAAPTGHSLNTPP